MLRYRPCILKNVLAVARVAKCLLMQVINTIFYIYNFFQIEPNAKKAKLSLIDRSVEYIKQLIASAPLSANICTVEDLRRELKINLPGSIFIQGHLTFVCVASEILPLTCSETEHMDDIEMLFLRAFSYSVKPGNEEMWASTADLLTGNVWSKLDDLTGALKMKPNQNARDPSGVTEKRLRPDYWLTVGGALLLKAEHKKLYSDMHQARAELADKMKGWNLVALRGLDFLPCYVVGGENLQFCAVVPNRDGLSCTVHNVSDEFDMTVPIQRLEIVKAAFNMFRILISLRRKMPSMVPTLYTEQSRSDGAAITIMDDHVLKVCQPTLLEIYACLSGEKKIRCTTSVEVKEKRGKFSSSGFVTLIIKPVCIEVLPCIENELKAAISAVLDALIDFHARGYVHRDIRWPNILRDVRGWWLLADFELADKVGALLPHRFRNSDHFSPEVRRGEPCTEALDMWQVGCLVQSWQQHPNVSSASLPISALAETFVVELRRVNMSALQARMHTWLA